jgi:hypothetical protein
MKSYPLTIQSQGSQIETWTHLYPLILNLSNELLTFVLSSERRGKWPINTPSPFLVERDGPVLSEIGGVRVS